MADDITTNEVLNVKLDYIQKDIAVIKSDVKEIKSDYITRRESTTQAKENKALTDDHEARIRSIESRVWKAIGALAILEIALPIILFFVKK